MLTFSSRPQIYSYQRFSNVEQAKGTSLDRQKELIEEVAKRYDLDLNHNFVMTDKGLSAYHGDHKKKGELGLFIKAVDTGMIAPGSVLIVESLDRLSREDVMTALGCFSELLKADITIITAMDEKTYTKDSLKDTGEILMSVLIMARANEESKAKEKRSVGFINKQLQNFYDGKKADVAGAIPFWISRIQSEDPKIKKGFYINDKREVIDLIIDLYFVKNKGLRSISKELLKRNISTPKGGEVWGVSTISSILNNEALFGRKRFILREKSKEKEEEIVLDDYFPAVMSKDDFESMQAIKKRKSGAGKGDKSKRGGLVYLLTDYGKKAVCAKCGRGIGSQPQRQKGHIRRRLHCYTHKEKGTCCKSIIQDYIEDAFLMSVARHIDYNLINKTVDPNQAILVSEKLEDIESQMDNIQELYIITKEKKRKASLLKRLEDLTQEKEHLKNKESSINQYSVSKEDINNFVQKVNDARNYENNEARLFIKDILLKSIKLLTVHMEKKKLEDFGYPNLFENSIVNVIDVEFYSGKTISIFVCCETNKTLFTRVSNDMTNLPFGSFRQQDLEYWNDNGGGELESLLRLTHNENQDSQEKYDELSIVDKAWLTSDFSESLLESMFDVLDSASAPQRK
ncbi:recombinase family protein [Vibrio splendidus]|uniref:recombinase family protein n=1 Tax=Vibrio splendidus TaxID=29497 RepID=UPI00076ACBD9|nr:recombinase family protein [Vibrio splendidus]